MKQAKEQKRKKRILELVKEEPKKDIVKIDNKCKKIEDLIKELAKICIEHKLNRKDGQQGGWYYFTQKDLTQINKAFVIKTGEKIDGGWMFLDQGEENLGLIRLYIEDCNPKWSFHKVGDDFQIEMD